MSTTAYFAVVVADEYHGRGIGAELMKRICEIARGRGLKAIIGCVLTRNIAMLALMSRLGFVEEADLENAELRRVVATHRQIQSCNTGKLAQW